MVTPLRRSLKQRTGATGKRERAEEVSEYPAPVSKKAGSEKPIEPGLANDRSIITTIKELEAPFGSYIGQREPEIE